MAETHFRWIRYGREEELGLLDADETRVRVSDDPHRGLTHGSPPLLANRPDVTLQVERGVDLATRSRGGASA